MPTRKGLKQVSQAVPGRKGPVGSWAPNLTTKEQAGMIPEPKGPKGPINNGPKAH